VIVRDAGLALLTTSGTATPLSPATPGAQPEWGLSFGPLAPPTISPGSGITTGTTVTATDGSWSATPQSLAYQWLRCNSAGSSCNPIPGATSKTYTVTSADDGSTLRVTVTATVSSGSASSTSAATALIQQSQSVAGQPPTVVEVPTMIVTPPLGQVAPAGQILVGSTFGAGLGTWRGQFPLSFAYQWKKCDPSGSCFAIPGATSSSFVPGSELYNWRIAVGVIASNSLGKAEATSQPWGPLTALAPRGSITPPITGSNVVGQTLTVGNGTFTGTAPFSYSYQWRRCDAPGTLPSCVPIAGARSATYTLTQADLGSTIRAYVTATNVVGSDTLITNHTFPTLPKPRFSPTATQAPRILGTVMVGYTLTASTGTWTGDAPITFALGWQRCDATGAGCVTVSSKRAYPITARDLGARLRLFVTAKNDNGSVSSTSGLTEAIQLTAHKKGRRIVGTAKPDYLGGGGFDDTIFGGGGNDTVLAGAGADRLFGGAGADVLVGGTGSDKIFGGPGSDTVMAADGERDTIDCGPGADRAVVDAIDVVTNCEAVQLANTAPAPTPTATTTSTSSTTTRP
jgi:Ca2+-binding RTX toxin-like protein